MAMAIVDVFKDVLSTQTLAEDDSQFDMFFQCDYTEKIPPTTQILFRMEAWKEEKHPYWKGTSSS